MHRQARPLREGRRFSGAGHRYTGRYHAAASLPPRIQEVPPCPSRAPPFLSPVPTTPRFSEQLRDTAAFGAVFSDHVLVADYVDGNGASR